MGFPRALARRVHEGARALFNAQGWYLGSAAQATPPIQGQVIEANAGAPARARSGHISALPPKPVFDLCSGMMSDQRDAVKAIDKLIQWSNGWADTLNTTLRVIKDEPKLTYAQILAHHTVRGNPPDADENKMFASKLYTEWNRHQHITIALGHHRRNLEARHPSSHCSRRRRIDALWQTMPRDRHTRCH